MTRSPLLVPALVALALLAGAPGAATATAAEPPVSIAFKVAANNGFSARVLTEGKKVGLQLERDGRRVSYEASYVTQGSPTATGLQAKFGRLGLIDVTFEARKTRTRKPPKGCEGEPTRVDEGVFVGAIKFVGEGEYVRIDAGQTKGTVEAVPNRAWRCHPRAARRKAPKSATLMVADRGSKHFFGAVNVADSSIFFGGLTESREKMVVSRSTLAVAGASAFVFDYAAGTATVHPPAPFSGSATFERRAHGRDSWRSTVEVPLVGDDSFSVRGHAYRAHLLRGFFGL